MHANDPYIDFEHIRRVVPLSLVLSHYGLTGKLKRVGSQLRGACPIHKGKNPRQFVIDVNRRAILTPYWG